MINLSEVKRPIGKLVEQYKTRENVHNVFGVILYTDRNPFVLKMLRDDDFWNALHEISGPRWPIFAIRPASGYKTSRVPRSTASAKKLMVPITRWHEPSANRELLETFKIADTRQLPMLLVFAEGNKGEVLQIAFKIKDADQNSCYKSLKSIVEKCAEAIEKVTAENIKNTEVIHGLMENVYYQEVIVNCFKTGVSFIQWFKSVR